MKKWIYSVIVLIIVIIILFMIFGGKKEGVLPDGGQNSATSSVGTSTGSSTSTTANSEATVLSSINKNNSKNKMTEQISKAGDTLTVNYTGTLEDGTKFDSSLDRGVPFKFIVGVGQVIRGWDEGMVGMKIGEKKRLVIPGEKAYGPNGISDGMGGYIIPPNATLIFDVELLGIENK